MSSVSVDVAKLREKFMRNDGVENSQVRSTEESVMTQMAIGNALLRKENREAILARARRDALQAVHGGGSSSSSSGASVTPQVVRERLPGTRRPMALSQAWQDWKAQQRVDEVGAVEATPNAKAKAKAKATPRPRQFSSMLPGSLSQSSAPASARAPQVSSGNEFKYKSTRTGMLVHTGTKEVIRLPEYSRLDEIREEAEPAGRQQEPAQDDSALPPWFEFTAQGPKF